MKTLKQRRGAMTLKSIHLAGVSSVPKTQRSEYLELYALGREKSRLLKEKQALETRKETIDRHLETICQRIVKLQQEMVQQYQGQMGMRTPSQPVKMVDINY